MPLRPDDLRPYGSARVVVTTPDGTFAGRFATDDLTESSILVLFIEDGGTADEPLAIDIERILEVTRTES
jgi:hypothetical protein